MTRLAGAAALLLAAVPLTARPPQNNKVEVVVSADGKGDYTEIAEAVAAAPDGATIRVRPGRYTRPVRLDKPVHVVGDGPRADVLLACTGDSTFRVSAPTGSIRGLTLRTTGEGYCLVVDTGAVLVEDCDVTAGGTMACLAIRKGADPTIRRCKVHGGKSDGVYVSGGKGTIEDCDLSDNGDGGVWLTAQADTLVRRCRMHGNASDAISVLDRSKGVFEDCDVARSRYGVWAGTGGHAVVKKCKIADCRDAAVTVRRESKATVEDCDLTGCRRGFEVDPAGELSERNNKTP